jgi:hypothetical protein
LQLLKKATVIATGVAMLMALGTSVAMADHDEVLVCHQTGNGQHPLTVDDNAVPGHEGHGDTVIEDPSECPVTDPPSEGDDDDDDDDDDAARNCSAESESGDSEADQEGLVNVGNVNLNLGNLGANALCQSSLLNSLTASVLGFATGGDSAGGGSAEGCSVESESGDSDADQDGLVNVGNVNVNAGNLASNLLCQSDVLDNAVVSVLGESVSGLNPFGGGLLLGGLDDVLGLLDVDASVLAVVAVIL